jgi:hypothetical protein
MVCESGFCFCVSDRAQCSPLVNTFTNHRVSFKMENSLNIWATVRLSTITMVNGISTLGAFAELRKDFIIFVRPNGETQFLLKGFRAIWYLRIFRKSIDRIQVWLNFDKNNEVLTRRPMYICDDIQLNSS